MGKEQTMVQSGNVMAAGARTGDRLEEKSSAATAREAALLLLLREVAAISQAQRDVLEVLGREVTSTSDFVEARVSAICGQLRRLLPASLNGATAKPLVVDPGIAHAVSSLITEVQFQDRARQRLQFVVDTLFALAECSSEADRAVTASLHESSERLPQEFIRFTDQVAHDALRRVRARVAASVPEGGPEAAYGGSFPTDEGVVDLF